MASHICLRSVCFSSRPKCTFTHPHHVVDCLGLALAGLLEGCWDVSAASVYVFCNSLDGRRPANFHIALVGISVLIVAYMHRFESMLMHDFPCCGSRCTLAIAVWALIGHAYSLAIAVQTLALY
jgi:hypothetical protein